MAILQYWFRLLRLTLVMLTIVKLCNSFSPFAPKSRSIVSKKRAPIKQSFSYDEQSLSKWVTAGLKFFEFHRCTVSGLGDEDDCFRISIVMHSEIAVYVGYNRNSPAVEDNLTAVNPIFGKNGKVYAILPDSSSVKASGAHDAVLVLDPTPKSSFGHLVGMFYVDRDIDAKDCNGKEHVHLSDGTCISLGRKPRCPNLLERFTATMQPRRCHVDFLPTVFSDDHVNSQGSGFSYSHDLLQCVPMTGFAECPKLRSLEETSKVLCDASETNSKRCDTSHSGVGTHCKLFQTCDQAVLIGGGWNRQHSGLQAMRNVLLMEKALKRSGFLTNNVKTFFANGRLTQRIVPKSHSGRTRRLAGDFLSSAMKTALRGHLRTMCETRHCADTLFIYLNNPTTYEGDMLLWDVDYNGIIDELEVYTMKEFLWDISGCEAKRVIIVADQRNTDIMITTLKTSQDHQNVMVLTAGLNNEIPINGEFTARFANHSHPAKCFSHLQKTVAGKMNGSKPVFYDFTDNLSSKISLVGTPCDLHPPVNLRELKTLYQGCQNVPTSIWFSFDVDDIEEGEGNSSDSSHRQESQESGGDNSGNGAHEENRDQDSYRRKMHSN